MLDGCWVDDRLLAGRAGEACLRLAEPVTRGELRAAVSDRSSDLAGAGLRPGGSVALRMPPGFEYVVTLLAAWRVGAQVCLLDHRLTDHEVGQALARIRPQLVISAAGSVAPYPDGRPAQTPHVLLQLSSGSTGPSKVIGRTAESLLAETERYRAIDGTPLPGERVVLLASMVHVLGLVGGLLFCLDTGVELAVPQALTTDAIHAAIAAGGGPTTVIGVPFHIEFLIVGPPRRLPRLRRMTVGGELVRPSVRRAFLDRHHAPLGVMYGMTEAGVMATDLSGDTWPGLRPAPGMRLREESGQLLLATGTSPYVGLIDPTRWVDGWLHTRDAGTVDPETGLVTVLGRLDSQVSVGGLKVDLTEVEQSLAELPGVAEVVVAYDGAIEAFVALDDRLDEAGLRLAIAERLAPYKRPRRITAVRKLPRTATGKLVRSLPALRRIAQEPKPERSPADVR